jgi:maltose/moltooligosaccharide transporter
MEAFKKECAQKNRFITDIIQNIGQMPSTMKKLGVVQFFSWFAFFTMWSMANPALTEHIFKTPAPIEAHYDFSTSKGLTDFDTDNTAFQESSNAVGSAMGVYGLSSMVFALLLTFYTSRQTINRKYVHMVSLTLGGLGFLAMYFASPSQLKYCFILIGFSWGSILSMPYAMLSSAVDPKKNGCFYGDFQYVYCNSTNCSSSGGN